jgi:acetoin utilization deacetylase AcuC-like enzyme
MDRVAVVDIDVHHGNGTQWSFYSDPRVLYVSTHQYPFYPGTGAADDVGEGAGRGFTVNIPLEAGATDADYEVAYRGVVRPLLDQFSPQLLLVSAGYDAHERDPLASMRVTTAGYAAVVSNLRDAAAGRYPIALVTEGGYELTALAECLEASFGVLTTSQTTSAVAAQASNERGGPASHGPRSGAAVRAERAIAAVRAAQAPYWRAI